VKKHIVAVITVGILFSLPFALVACGMKKNDASAEGGVTVASASAATTDTAPSASAATTSDTPHAAIAPAANVPGVVTDPNARPSTESDDNAAKAEISKANYKKELDRLEKEDLAK
jgi:hypothetical protein